MTIDVTSLLGVLPVTSREITRDETSISWRKVKLRLSVSRSNAPSPESVHEGLPDYEDAPETGSHTNDQGGAEDEDDASEEVDELEEDNEVASDHEYSNPLPSPPRHLPSALGLDFTSPIDLTPDDQQARVLSQLASIDLRDSTDRDISCESRLREADAFIASAVSYATLAPTPSPLSPPETSHEHHEVQSTRMSVRRVGLYETIYGLSDPDPDSDEEDYFEISRPGIARWSSTPTPTTTKTRPVHQELSLHPRSPSFLSVIPRYHRTYSTTWFTKNDRVKRVLDARKRRHASNPDVVRGEGFVKKAVERFGPTWRPRLPSVFGNGLRKKKADESAVTVEVVSSDSRSLVGKGIERPANVPRVGDPQSDAYTRLTIPSRTDTVSTVSSVSIQSDATMNQDDEEVPEFIVVPSTPPPSLPTLVAHQPSTLPLPYLVSQANSGRAGGGYYPYVATPPLDSRNADSVTVSSGSHSQPVPLPYLVPQANSGGGGQVEYAYIPTPPLDPTPLPTPRITREASLPTPRLTREASFASSNSSFVPTPESGRLTLPTVPVDGLGVPCVEEILRTKSSVQTADDGDRYSYVATPPLPTAGLPPSLPLSSTSFTPLSSTSTLNPPLQPPAPIIPPTLLSLPTLPTLPTPVPPPPPLTTILPSFPVGQPPPPLPPLQPIIPPTLTLPLPTTAQPAPPPPPLTTVLPSFLVGQPPPPLPPLIPPLVPSLSVAVPLAVSGTGCMRSSLPPPLSASSGFFRPLESRMITRALPLQSISVGSSSHVGSASGVVSIHSLPTTGPALSFTATAPTLQLQIPLSATSRIAESTPPSESMDCEEDAYAPLIKMTSPTEVQPSRPDFVMGEGGGLYPVADLVHMGKEPNTESLGGEVAKHGIVDVRTDGSSYQGASGSGYVAGNTSAKDEKGKSKAEDDSEDGLGGDPPPFDESDPLWEELLAYTAGPDGNGLGFSSCVDAAGLNEVATSTSQHVGVAQNFGGDPTRAQTSFDLNTSWDSNELSWDFSDVLNSGADNPPHPSESQSDVWKELCAWADEQPPEMLESVFGMLDTSESFVAEEPSVEPVGLGDFPFFEESPSLELPVAIITVESPTQPLPSPTEYNPHPQVAQDAIYSEEKRHMYPSSLEASATFTLDELDWDVMEEYAQLEDLECPDNSVDAARVMVVAIRAVADKAKTAFVDRTSRSEGGVFLPPGVIDFPAGYPAIVGGQSISPSYQYVSLLDEDVQEPVDSYYHHQTYPQPTSLPHVLAAS